MAKAGETDQSRREALAFMGLAPLLTGAAAAPSQAQTAAPPPGGAPKLCIVSRHLQWAPVEQAIAFAKEAGFEAIAWTVRPGAHVLPEEVEKELPRVVDLTRKAGIEVPEIITAIGDVNAPHAEAILATLKQLGIPHYRAITQRYDYASEMAPQWAAQARRIDGLEKLNQKHGVTAMFHTHSYANTIGGPGWDIWMLLKDRDPRFVGINFDIGHITAKGGTGWVEVSHAAHPYIRALSLKDFRWTKHADAPAGVWPWYTKFCPPGEGMVDFVGCFKYFKSIGFTGPIGVYYEYMADVPGQVAPVNMLGTDYGKWRLEMSRELFLSLVRRDREFYQKAMAQAGLA